MIGNLGLLEVLFMAAFMAAFVVILLVVARKVIRFIAPARDVRDELQLVTDRLAQLEAEAVDPEEHQEVMARLAETEERLEFAERLLAQQGLKLPLPEPTDEVTDTGEPGVDRG